MSQATKNIENTYGNRLRVRVCGILIENNQILLVKHKSNTLSGVFWAPPGGGLEFGETTEDALKREFLEETRLEIEVGDFLCVNEYLKAPLHGIELFFYVTKIGGKLQKGLDPELELDNQIIEEIKFVSLADLSNDYKSESYHSILDDITNKKKFFYRNGT